MAGEEDDNFVPEDKNVQPTARNLPYLDSPYVRELYRVISAQTDVNKR